MSYLKKYRDFFSTYYAIAEDYAKEDFDSASYKYTRLQQDALSMNDAGEDVFEQYEERDNEGTKKIISTVAKQTELIKDFYKNNLHRYPLLTEVSAFDEDLVLCQLYTYKSFSLYENIMGEYPSAMNFDDLLIELSSVAPRTDKLDKLFNKQQVDYYQNNKEISFRCKSKVTDKKFTFTALKEGK